MTKPSADMQVLNWDELKSARLAFASAAQESCESYCKLEVEDICASGQPTPKVQKMTKIKALWQNCVVTRLTKNGEHEPVGLRIESRKASDT